MKNKITGLLRGNASLKAKEIAREIEPVAKDVIEHSKFKGVFFTAVLSDIFSHKIDGDIRDAN